MKRIGSNQKNSNTGVNTVAVCRATVAEGPLSKRKVMKAAACVAGGPGCSRQNVKQYAERAVLSEGDKWT